MGIQSVFWGKTGGIELTRICQSGPEVRVVAHCAMAGSVSWSVSQGPSRRLALFCFHTSKFQDSQPCLATCVALRPNDWKYRDLALQTLKLPKTSGPTRKLPKLPVREESGKSWEVGLPQIAKNFRATCQKLVAIWKFGSPNLQKAQNPQRDPRIAKNFGQRRFWRDWTFCPSWIGLPASFAAGLPGGLPGGSPGDSLGDTPGD